MPRIDRSAVPVRDGTGYPAPLAGAVAGRTRQRLGDAGGLTQFGVNLCRLAPGAASSLRHWHTHEDEFVLVLEGEATLLEDGGETLMRAGEAAAFKAGVADGHCFVNRGAADCLLLEVGTRAPAEAVEYPDHDLTYRRGPAGPAFARRDGTPW